MATPSSRPHSHSTPKNNPAATPTHFTSSPYPAASAAMARGLSHKSSSIRTPASVHGHNHHPSSSSHPSATPLAASTSVDDVAMSSPSAAALVALGLGGAHSGITPSPIPTNGIGGSRQNMQGIDMAGLGIAPPRDIEEERLRNIAEVVRLLGTRAYGRHVSREGVAQIGESVGSDTYWDGDTLSIAGTRTLVDVTFDAQDKDVVVKVEVSFPESSGGGAYAADATKVLEADLTQSPEERRQGYWKSLEGFKINLERLVRLDRLSGDVNCFEALEGLYESLRKIWDAERTRERTSGPWRTLCQTSLGKPVFHKGKTIGLALEYWVEERRLLDRRVKRSAASGNMDIDQPDNFPADEDAKTWSALLECEQCSTELYPSLRISRDWVSEEVLKHVQPDPSTEASQTQQKDAGNTYVDWLEPLPTIGSPNKVMKENPDDSVPDSTILNMSKPSDVRFVARFEPPVLVPLQIAYQIHQTVGTNMQQDPIQIKLYDDMLFPSSTHSTSPSSSNDTTQGSSSDSVKAQEDDNPPVNIGLAPRTRRRQIEFGEGPNGKMIHKKHLYSLYTKDRDLGREITSIPFSHPRQLSNMLPTLRQYALLSNLLRYTFALDVPKSPSTLSHPSQSNGTSPHKRRHVRKRSRAEGDSDSSSEDENGTKTITNQPRLLAKLDALLAASTPTTKPTFGINGNQSFSELGNISTITNGIPKRSKKPRPATRPITVTLSTTPPHAPTITLTTPLILPGEQQQGRPISPSQSSHKTNGSLPKSRALNGNGNANGTHSIMPSALTNVMLFITIAVNANGGISIPEFHIPGVDVDFHPHHHSHSHNPDDPQEETETTDDTKKKSESELESEKSALKELWTRRIIQAVELSGENEKGGLGFVVEWVLRRAEMDRMEKTTTTTTNGKNGY